MRLTSENSIHAVSHLLQNQVAPEIRDGFFAQSVRLAGSLLNICARAVDDAAELRVEENAAIRAALGDVATVAPGDLANTLRAGAQSRDPGLKVSVLDIENNRLRHMLIEAQTWLETSTDRAAGDLNQRIWRLLSAIELNRGPREAG